MSLKPQKRSDAGKRWMRERRDRGIQIKPEYHLIVTEGRETEPAYFQAIQSIINQRYRNRIHLEVHGEGDNTLSLYEKARLRAESSPNVYKHVWVVYDTDDFPAEHINLTAELCKQNSSSETQYHALWSNQCFELWYLLHFSYFQSDVHRREYWPKLTEQLERIGKGAYVKNRPDMYDTLRPYMKDGIKNAQKLDKHNQGRKPSDAAPGTKVYELIDALKSYLID